VDRRGFLVRTGLTFAASALASLPVASGAPVRQAEDWEAVRGLFSLNPAYLHFGGLLLASHPAPVQTAIETHRRGLDDNPVDYLHQQQGPREAAVLRSAATYLRADPTEKLEALTAIAPLSLQRGRFQAPDKLIAMLKAVGGSKNYAE